MATPSIPASELPPSPSQARISTDRVALAMADQIECALLACDFKGQLLHGNRAGHRALANGNAVALEGHRVCGVASPRREWFAAIRGAATHFLSRLVWVGPPAHRSMVAIVPILFDGARLPTAMVMLGRSSVCSNMGVELLASHHALSFAERRTLRALLGNASPREIAAMHGVPVSTIRAQIKTLRKKIGVRSTDAILLRAAEVPPIPSWH